MKQKYLFLMLMLLCTTIAQAQVTYPVNGVADNREGYYAFTNATVYTDYQTKVEGATLVIRNGKVTAVGKGLKVPKGATEIDLKGKYVYPSMIDLYTGYAMPKPKRSRGFSFASFAASIDQFISKKKGAYNWNQTVLPEVNAEQLFTIDQKQAKKWRKMGFGAVLTHKQDGVMRGTGALVTLANGRDNEVILKGQASTHYSFSKGSSTQPYPNSMMGTVALVRQTMLDADWYAKGGGKKEKNLSLDAFNATKKLPAIFEARNWQDALIIHKVAKEFGKEFIIRGSGDEYHRMDEIKATGASFILPLRFPKAFKVEDPLDAEMVSLAQMKHWELAATNLARLEKAGVNFALTAAGNPAFWKNLKKAIKMGLSEKTALKALTYTPAQLMKMDNQLGSLKKGMHANFIITSGNLFKGKNSIYENWVQGKRYVLKTMPTLDLRGVYAMTLGTKSGYELHVSGKPGSPKFAIKQPGDSSNTKVKGKMSGSLVTLSFNLDKKKKGALKTRLSGWAAKKKFAGTGEDAEGKTIAWAATYKGKLPPPPQKKDKKGKDSKKKTPATQSDMGEVIYPFVAFGNKEKPKATDMLIKNATVWTNEKDGILENTDVLIKNGKIAKIGKNLSAGGAKVVDGKGKHLTPGIVDEHSHIALRSVNEGSQSNSAEVRMEDVVDSEDINIYRQLSGGVTAAQLLHGSANPVGGQSALIKLKWGEAPEKLLIPGTDGYIKFALGENVKRSRYGFLARGRYPQTRMGVEQVFVDAFTRAKEYKAAKAKGGANFRKDLELEAMLEVMEKKRFVSCHSYVQSEINMLMKVAERFNFRINTFTHILEGYKVADKMAKHGAGGSTFSDWWAYKYEVKDAIPYNAALMHQAGVVVAINSDDAEMARRLNQEAAKAVKYGGVSQEEALKMVTLNAAKLLHLDKRIGSIKTGKDADLVLWTANPLSIYAKADKTIIEGTVYYDAKQDEQKRAEVKKERTRLIKKMMSKGGKGGGKRPRMRRQRLLHCDDLGGERILWHLGGEQDKVNTEQATEHNHRR
ncbi:amidohydrolase family protein [Microscilla marina]|nr:amidohydrolase family protein [Microscilla marina]